MLTRIKVFVGSTLDLIKNAKTYREIADQSAMAIIAVGEASTHDESPYETITRVITGSRREVVELRGYIAGQQFAARLQGIVTKAIAERNIELTDSIENILEELGEVKSPNGTTKKVMRQLEELLAGPVEEAEAEAPHAADDSNLEAVEREATDA